MSLNNQPCITRPILINSKTYIIISFLVKIDRCSGSCNTFNDLSSRICVSNKAKYIFTCF